MELYSSNVALSVLNATITTVVALYFKGSPHHIVTQLALQHSPTCNYLQPLSQMAVARSYIGVGWPLDFRLET